MGAKEENGDGGGIWPPIEQVSAIGLTTFCIYFPNFYFEVGK